MESLIGKRALVSGAAGFIGANLVRELIKKKVSVTSLISSGGNAWRLNGVNEEMDIIEADIRDRLSLKKAIGNRRFDLIFNLAVSHGHHGPGDQNEALETSLIGTANLLETALEQKVMRFIQAGSSLEYGFSDRPRRETDPLFPATIRGAAKASASVLCRCYATAYGVPVVIARLFSVYGYWESPRRLIPKAISSILTGRRIDLTGPGYRRDPVFIDDVIDALLKSALANNRSGLLEINIGSGRQHDNEEIIRLIGELTGKEARVNIGAYPPSPSDTGYWVADINKAEKLLKWRPRHDLERV